VQIVAEKPHAASVAQDSSPVVVADGLGTGAVQDNKAVHFVVLHTHTVVARTAVAHTAFVHQHVLGVGSRVEAVG